MAPARRADDEMLALLYDWEHDEFDEDVDLYLSLAARTGGPILELACGSGRLLEPLALSGAEVTGADLSASMLARAGQRLQAAGTSAVLHNMDMTVDLPAGPFSLVILALDAFGFVLETDDQIALLERIGASAARGAELVLDLVHPGSLFDPPGGTPVLQRSGWCDELQAEVAKWVVRDVSFSEQQLALRCFYDVASRGGQLRRLVERVPLRHYSRFEVELLCRAAGWKVKGVYGDYALGPLQDTSDRMIFMAGRE